ncbi:hypothetical protein ES702_00063 [subsurface metagenome]
MIRQKSNHVCLKHSDGGVTIVPVRKGGDIDRGLLRKIFKDADLLVEDFIKFVIVCKKENLFFHKLLKLLWKLPKGYIMKLGSGKRIIPKHDLGLRTIDHLSVHTG